LIQTPNSSGSGLACRDSSYGLTETASLVSVNHPFKQGRGSIGKVLPGQEVKLAENGEILMRGENLSPGYWNDARQSRAAESGWFRTGDGW